MLSVIREVGKMKVPEVLKYASAALKNDEKVVSEAIQKSSLALEYASDELKSNRKLY